MFDIKKVEEDARKEVAEEQATKAKAQIKTKLKAISDAKSVVANLEKEYEILLKTIGE